MSSKRCAIPFSVLLTVVLLLPAGGNSSGKANTGTVPGQDPTSAAAAGRLMFIENASQWPEDARFQVWGGTQTLWLAEDAIWLTILGRGEASPEDLAADQMPRTDEPWQRERESRGMPRPYTTRVNIRVSFPGANPHPRLEPFDRLDTHVSYFIGADPEKWRAGVPVWGGVRYVDLYPGVDLIVGAGLAPALGGGRPPGSPLPWRLEAREGADLAAVRLRVEGAGAVAVDGDALRLSTALGDFAVPLLTLERANVERANVECLNAQAFDVTAPFAMTRPNPASRDASSPQPSELLYATFLGGSGHDDGNGIAVDAAGSAYVAGETYSSGFPTTPGALDTSYNGGDAFVVKLNPDGSGLIYATFLGGSGADRGLAIAVDTTGRAYVTGKTSSSDFPATPGAFDTGYNDWWDAFVVKLNPTGSGLVYATFLGGSLEDYGDAIVVDEAGRVYVTGCTYSHNFPTTLGAFDMSHNDGATTSSGDAFVAKLEPVGSGLTYATFLGGSQSDNGRAIAVDMAGSAYVTGQTWSNDFPTTPDAFDTSHNGGDGDAFVVKLDPVGSQLAYATFLGDSGLDWGFAIAADALGYAYVTGYTYSRNFPTTPGAFDTSHNGGGDAFVVKLELAGNTLAYATFLGGHDGDSGGAIAVDMAGSAHVTGWTSSSDFPTTPDSFDISFNGGDGDAFVVKLDPSGTQLAYATFLGGNGLDGGGSIAVDTAGFVYLLGGTSSSAFPITPGAFDTSYNGGGTDYVSGDAFVVKLSAGPPLPSPTILGTTWYDLDGDGLQGAGEPGLVAVVVKLFRNGLQIGQTTTSADGTYGFAGLPPATYTVRERQPAWLRFSTTPDVVTVVLAAGQESQVDFGDWNGRPTWLPMILR